MHVMLLGWPCIMAVTFMSPWVTNLWANDSHRTSTCETSNVRRSRSPERLGRTPCRAPLYPHGIGNLTGWRARGRAQSSLQVSHIRAFGI